MTHAPPPETERGPDPVPEPVAPGPPGKAPSSALNVPLVVILVVAVLVRVVVAVGILREPELVRASDDYVGMGAEWLEVGRYVDTARPPGYPFLARVFIQMFGTPGVFQALVVVHVITGVAAVWLLFRIAGLMGLGRAEALVAAGLLALDPITVSYTALALTETPYLVSLLLGLYLALLSGAGGAGETRRGLWVAAGAGAALAAATLVRTVGLLATVALGAWTLFQRGTGTGKQRLARAAVMVGMVAATTGAWSYRNLQHYDHFVYTPSSGLIFAMMWVGPARLMAENRPVELIEALRVWSPEEVGEAYYSENRAEVAKGLSRAARRWAIRNPDAMVAGLVRSNLLLWLGPGREPWEKITGIEPLPGGAVALMVLWRLMFLLGGAVGAFLWWDNKPQARGALICVALLILVNPLALGCGGYPRYAAPMLPFVALLVAVALVYGVRLLRARAVSDAGNPDTT